MNIYELPEQLKNKVTSELEPLERIVWLDQPIAKKLATGFIPFSLAGILITGFVLFWIAGANGFKMPNFKSPGSYFALFGIPFFFLGITMLLSPLLMLRSAKTIVYVLTDKRAIIIQKKGRSFLFRSYWPGHLSSIFTREDNNGNGDITFEGVGQLTRDGRNKTVGFFAIRNVKEVKRMVDSLIQGHARKEDI